MQTKISITRPLTLASGWHNFKVFQIFADGYLTVGRGGIFLIIYLLKYTINPFPETDYLS
jgi:hypothetical protein